MKRLARTDDLQSCCNYIKEKIENLADYLIVSCYPEGDTAKIEVEANASKMLEKTREQASDLFDIYVDYKISIYANGPFRSLIEHNCNMIGYTTYDWEDNKNKICF